MVSVLSGCAVLMPNALLVAAAIDALGTIGGGCSPKSDDIGWALGTNAAWVRRHGGALDAGHYPEAGAPRLANLSVNGHCSLYPEGMQLAAALRAAESTEPPPETCGYCRSGTVGAVHAGRQLYACGAVRQFCPAHVPGLAKPEIPARSRKSQHGGRWFRVLGCGGFREYGLCSAPIAESLTIDGVRLLPGHPVSGSMGSGRLRAYADSIGTVLEAANGTVLVSWPAVPRNPQDGTPYPKLSDAPLEADIVSARTLVSPGGPDSGGLSDYQDSLWREIHGGRVELRVDPDSRRYGGTFNGRRIHPVALDVLVAHRLIPPPEAALAAAQARQ